MLETPGRRWRQREQKFPSPSDTQRNTQREQIRIIIRTHNKIIRELKWSGLLLCRLNITVILMRHNLSGDALYWWRLNSNLTSLPVRPLAPVSTVTDRETLGRWRVSLQRVSKTALEPNKVLGKSMYLHTLHLLLGGVFDLCDTKR